MKNTLMLGLLGCALLSCAPKQTVDKNIQSPKPSGKIEVKGIMTVPNSAPKKIRQYFDRYTQITAPNGKNITIYAQNKITDAQIIQARNTLVFWLTDVPNSRYGSDKSAVANNMANNKATLNLLNGVDDGSNPASRLGGQPLYAGELVVPGSKAYMTNDYKHRDATFEEILHLMHDTGIGVDGAGGMTGALPNFQAKIRAATNNAISNNFQIWPTTAANKGSEYSWFNELKRENSLTQEYLASVIDSYYGLWGPYQKANAGMWGFYIAKTRADIKSKDPMGWALMSDFFSPYLTYNAQLDSSLTGTFSMTFEAKKPYTHKSQYLLNATLTGSNNANLTGNDQNNKLAGNAGNNILNGLAGTDTVIYNKPKSSYVITKNSNGNVKVVGEGTDTLINIEKIVFKDETILVSSL